MLTSFLDWLDHRTGYRHAIDEALYENIPGGARWRYVTGSMLTFAFATQVITGFFLWMFYSPSSQTAWESVYYIQHEVTGGWLVRGIHHFMAQAMVVLLGLHLLQVVWDGAYRAPREMNFWLGLVLMKLVLALALTGYLLPWDQKGYWATSVATNLATLIPLAGESAQKLAVGGEQYGHLTLTRFFALHAGILPTLLTIVLVFHLLLFRKHGITAHPQPGDVDEKFWPKQVLYDAIGCFAVLLLVIGLAFIPGRMASPEPGHWGAELGAPADASEAYGAARPEWYFLFLFQLLKYFEGGLDIIGALVIPGAVFFVLAMMPIIAYSDWGHRFNQAFIILVLLGAGILTAQAMYNDNYASLVESGRVAAPAEEDEHGQLALSRSREYLDGVSDAKEEAKRFVELAHEKGIPKTGAKELGLNDPVIRGRRLFKTNCAACHSYLDENNQGIRAKEPSAPNLYGFASRAWLTKLLDEKEFFSPHYFGKTKHSGGDMATYIKDEFPGKRKADGEGNQLKDLISMLSSEAKRGDQKDLDVAALKDGTIERGKKAFVTYGCTDCHVLHDDGSENGPTLTGYGSQDWLVGMISEPDQAGFYGKSNDRMPSYAKGKDPAQHQMSKADIALIAQWLRADYSGEHKPVAAIEPQIPTVDEPEPPKGEEKKDEKKTEEKKADVKPEEKPADK